MKRYEIYRDIRKKALIYGLPVPLFALMMISIIGSLLVIIFSFSLLMIIGAVSLNLVMYAVLSRVAANPQWMYFRKVFPVLISSKKSSEIFYEN